MGSVNKAIIVGNLGRDPEMRYTPNGQANTKFSVATSRSYKKNDEWVEETDWHNVVIWGQAAERAAEQLTKGKQVYVEGRIRNYSYDDKDGNKKYGSEIVADRFVLLGRRDDAAGGQYGTPDTEGTFEGAPVAAKASPRRQMEEAYDDLPF